jgi:hypothetical protein
VIATSLRAIKGRDADSARALFKAFRLVPEDVKVPLQALAWVYEASTGAGAGAGAGETPSLLQLRRCVGDYISRRPLPHTVLECRASKVINRDACPRPTPAGRSS